MIISLENAQDLLLKGQVLAAPTEAVYGLSVDPRNISAIQKLLALKQRDSKKGLILVAGNIQQLDPWVNWRGLTQAQKDRVFSSWPGPVTWVVPVKPEVSEWVRGNFDSIAVRVTSHPVMKNLCETSGHALISTSANLSDQDPARIVKEVEQQFGVHFPVLIGELGGLNKPTNIMDALSGQLLRK